MKRFIISVFGLILGFQSMFAAPRATIIRLKGDVKVRRGIEENWRQAQSGLLLEDVDTILLGEASEAALKLESGVVFQLGSQSILDISDLKQITERELFLYLMSQKIGKIPENEKASILHIENVSVVRGEKKRLESSADQGEMSTEMWAMEKNGARALYDQKYYPNAIIKFYKILDKYPNVDDESEIYVYLGQSFEAIQEPGRAFDIYQLALNRMSRENTQNIELEKRKAWVNEAISRLKEDAPLNQDKGE